jgi:hypothetical protein
MARPKEPHFFDLHFDKGLAWYEQMFASAPAGALCGEATPAYIYEPAALGRMAQVVPRAKLIVSLRNPIDQAYSEYWHRRSERREARAFTDAFPDLLHTDAYLGQLESACDFYPRKALKVVFSEDLLRSYRDACRFIGARDIPPSHPEQRVAAYSRVRSERVREISDLLRRPASPRPLRGIARVLRRANTSHLPYPSMDPELRAHLVSLVDTTPLQAWLGHELPWG